MLSKGRSCYMANTLSPIDHTVSQRLTLAAICSPQASRSGPETGTEYLMFTISKTPSPVNSRTVSE